MRAILVWIAVLLACPALAAQERNHASWWITSYGLLDASDEPLVPRAEKVFERLIAAAEKRANRFPRLAILDAEGNPFAMALPDGTILLTRGALRISYQRVQEEAGDARLAFVIAHELAHLGNDDFWHAAAFDAVKPRSDLRELFREPPEASMRRELQADAYGMLYMTTAGYDPQIILRKESFFEEWAESLDALGVRTAASHPAPAKRGAFLRVQLNAIVSEIDYFHFGARLVQLGRFQDGLLLLERFRDRFPSREVLNNIGVAHYQLAARYLGNCDGRLIVRFKLPTVVDSRTRAVRLRSAAGSSPCFRAERFRLHFREAERNLTEATEMDPTYAPAKLNLLSLYALAEEGAQAIAAADEAKKIIANDPRVESGAAVALYLYGETSGLEMADTAIEKLQLLHRNQPESAEAAYNLASMLAERRRVQAAEDAYRAFLALEPRGIYADLARDYVDASSDRVEPIPTVASNLPESPLPLGPLDRGAIADTRIEDFVIGDFKGSFIQLARGRALAIDETIELVEYELDEPLTVESLSRLHGAPRETITSPFETLHVYVDKAFVSRAGLVVLLVHFKD